MARLLLAAALACLLTGCCCLVTPLPPTSPDPVQAVATSPWCLAVRWSVSRGGMNNYVVYAGPNPGAMQPVMTVPSTQTAVELPNAKAGTTYYLRVEAVGPGGRTSSVIVSVTTPAADPPPPPQDPPKDPPPPVDPPPTDPPPQPPGLTVQQQVNILVVARGPDWVGVPYRSGGKYKPGGDRSQGTDCSNFVSQVYVSVIPGFVPVTTADIVTSPKFVQVAAPAPGDLVLFPKTARDPDAHVGIVTDPTRGNFIGAQSSTGVAETSYLQNPYWKARPRVFYHYRGS